jgi:hypothetical protein
MVTAELAVAELAVIRPELRQRLNKFFRHADLSGLVRNHLTLLRMCVRFREAHERTQTALLWADPKALSSRYDFSCECRVEFALLQMGDR